MKRKQLLLTLALAAVMSAGAQNPVGRGTSVTPGQVRQVNTMQHAATARPTLRKAAAEAPANAVEVPFTHDLGKNGAEVKNYTVIDANGDGRGWKPGATTSYIACMLANAADVDRNDDWLVTVPIHMTAGNYVVSFKLGFMTTSANAVEMAVMLGKTPTVDGMIAEISPKTEYTEHDMVVYEYNCAVPEDGYYYIGFHCTTSKTQKGTLKLNNLSVRSGSIVPPVTQDPPAAGTLTWELAPKGELKATVKYTAPTKTKSGEDLTEITKVELTSRWGVDKYEFENVQPGQVITQEVEMYAGINNRFTGVAYTGNVAGDMVEHKSIFCGPDTPLAPTDVKLTVADDYKTATLSWTAPGETGENGGYVDTEKLTYYVFDAFGNYYDPYLYTTDKTSIVIEYPDLKGQDFFAYQVTAGVDDYYSLDCASNIVTVGEPAKMPFKESFANGYYDGMWLIDPESSGSGTMQYGTITDDYFASLFDPEDPDAPEPLVSHDGDNGFYYWLPIEKDAMFGLVSLRTDISKAAHPVLDFWYQGQGSVIDVLVAGGADGLKVAKSIDLKANPTTGWTLARVALDEYKSKGAVQFEIRLTAAHNDDDHTWSVPFDAIRIHDLADKNLGVVSLEAPATTRPGEKLQLKARVENLGTDAAEGAVASLKVGGETVASKEIPAVASNGFASVELEYTVPMNAPDKLAVELNVALDGDKIADDNNATAEIEVRRAAYATVTDLKADADNGQVTLTWTAPVNDSSTPVIVEEDFESDEYTAMSISGAGEWKVYDGDGVKTYNVFRELYNPYQTQPIGFQLFNRVAAQVPETFWLDAEPHSGNTFMMAPSAQMAANDNWLISPELSGNAQTVKFWAKSFSSAWPETMKVYYSTTGSGVESFTTEVQTVSGMPASGNLPEVWTEFSFALPVGAKYFAFNHDAYDTVALLIDDVCFEGLPAVPAYLAVTGYHVLCNGTQLTQEPVDALTFTHAPLETVETPGDYDFAYTVVPVYNHGGAGQESNTATVSLSLSGITEIEADKIGVDAVIYNLSGVRVSAQSIEPGVYIVVSGGKAEKAMIK